MKIQEIRKLLDTRKLGAVELTEFYLKKIHDDDSNSFITVCDEDALHYAEKAQRMIDGKAVHLMTGIPVAIKDNICTQGIKTSCGSAMLDNFVPEYDAFVIKRMKECGAVILGKTNMDEFAMGSECNNLYYGCVKNPINPDLIPGGSSGGSAVAVKKELCVASLGSDTGGSVRLPAAFCGVVGFKPSYGGLSRNGLIAFASSLDQIGILSASADDLSYILDSVSGADKMDMTSFNCDFQPAKLSGFKIGICKELFDMCDSRIASAVYEGVEVLESCGGKAEAISIPELDYIVPAYFAVSSAEACSNLGRYDGIRYGVRKYGSCYGQIRENTVESGFGDEVKKRIALGRNVLADGRYEKGVKIRKSVTATINKVFESCDVIIHPTSAVFPYKAGECDDSAVKTNICTVMENLVGIPCVSVPCKTIVNNLPVGMSITAPKEKDGVALAVAQLYERSANSGI